jgi:hypothetical protein
MSPGRPAAGHAFAVSVRLLLAPNARSVAVQCSARAGRRLVRLAGRGLAGPAVRRTAFCRWKLPRGASGQRLTGTVIIRVGGETARRAFSLRIG